MIFNDHVIGLIGSHFGAPVPRTALVIIPEELIRNEPEMAGAAGTGDRQDSLAAAGRQLASVSRRCL